LYDAGFVTESTGEELTKNAREIGVQRQAAVSSTGVVTFRRDSAATTDYTIPSGTRVGTGGESNVTFETTEFTTIKGPSTSTDTTLYSTSSTSFVTKTSFTVNTTYRNNITVDADIRTTDSAYPASVKLVDVTNGTTITTLSTTNTSFTTKTTTYDTSLISGDVTIEARLASDDTNTTVELDSSAVTVSGMIAAQANVACTEAGPVGNVGANTITALIDKPTGVQTVTNNNPTGDPEYTLTDGQTVQQTGQARESDASLRERALESTAIGGAGTAEAVELAIDNIEEVISADVRTNRIDSTVDGIGPYETEVRVYGGDAMTIAQRLYEVLPISTLLSLVGGANGTREAVTIEADELYGTITVPITRPVTTNLTIDIDVVHNSTYAGSDAVSDAIVAYIGGTTSSARREVGLKQGENVLVNGVENVAEDVAGVEFADVTLLDADGDGTDDTTTDADGVTVYAVSKSEVAIVDTADITVAETAR